MSMQWLDKVQELNDRFLRTFMSLAMSVGTVAMMGALLYQVTRPTLYKPPTVPSVDAAARIAVLEVRQLKVEQALSLLATPTAPTAGRLNADFRTIATQQKGLDARLQSLESALGSDVGKAMAVPLIRKDIDALQDKSRSDLVLIQNEIGRLFTMATWFLGALATICLSMLSFQFARRRDKEPSTK